MRIPKSHYWVVAAVSAGGLATLLVSVAPSFRFAYPQRPRHLVLETASGLIALLAAYLLFGRFRATGRLSDVSLVCALVLFAASNLVLAAMPAALWPETHSQRFATWAPLIGRLLGAVLFASSPFLRSVQGSSDEARVGSRGRAVGRPDRGGGSARRRFRVAPVAGNRSEPVAALGAHVIREPGRGRTGICGLGRGSLDRRPRPALSWAPAVLLVCAVLVAAAIGLARMA